MSGEAYQAGGGGAVGSQVGPLSVRNSQKHHHELVAPLTF
jgi:hypothetical protein